MNYYFFFTPHLGNSNLKKEEKVFGVISDATHNPVYSGEVHSKFFDGQGSF